jgi:hypothetical protein
VIGLGRPFFVVRRKYQKRSINLQRDFNGEEQRNNGGAVEI